MYYEVDQELANKTRNKAYKNLEKSLMKKYSILGRTVNGLTVYDEKTGIVFSVKPTIHNDGEGALYLVKKSLESAIEQAKRFHPNFIQEAEESISKADALLNK